MGSPEVQDVALGGTLWVQAAEHIFPQVDRKGLASFAGWFMQWTGALQLRVATQTLKVSHFLQYLLDRYLPTQVSVVD